jgi:hypothetical protein
VSRRIDPDENARRSASPSGKNRKHVTEAPDWTNPNIGMVALICGAYHAYGEEGLLVSKRALYRLGIRTGRYMIEQGLVPSDCTPTEWGRFTLDLMDLTGFYRHEEVEASPTRYEFRVTEYPYLEPYRYLDAPRDICDIPGYWDRGCLATINPRILMSKPACFWWGDGECRWVYELSDGLVADEPR